MSRSSQTTVSVLQRPVSEDRDHIRGLPTAEITLVEYGDFECPHCGQAHLILNSLMQLFDDRLRLAFRHFPLSQIHPHAQQAAEAAESAGAQGQFWEMHDILFENQDSLDAEGIAELAQELDLDMVRFLRDLSGGVFAERIREDFLSGVRSGVNGTPTFFINGERHDGPWDLESLSAAIDAQVHPLAERRHGKGIRHK